MWTLGDELLHYQKERIWGETGKFEIASFRQTLKEGMWALLLPVIILFGIRGVLQNHAASELTGTLI
jgi:TRAP-type C4-dicarboxylate transport system permease large subunit